MKDQKKIPEQLGGAMSRREFLGTTAAAAAAVTILPRHVLGGPGYISPNDRLNIAGIGVGGMGADNIAQINSLNTENIYALCDVDEDYASKTFKLYPNAKKFRDFRKMLESEKEIDAVVIATPDHTHAVIAMMAIKMGKHVFCQKPLTRTIYEARRLSQAAREANVASQMGNQGHASEGARLINEWIWDGAIGPVREVHCWTDRPIWPQGVERPQETPAVPSTLDWDLWLGPAPYRPYHPAYVPFNWRGWWDFGVGALGDMAPHIIDHPYWALKLGYPTSVEASTTPLNKETYPLASIVRFEFPARGDMPPVTLTWYDGGMMPRRPNDLEPGRRRGNEDGGVMYVGDKGMLMHGCYGETPRLIPESRMNEYERPPKTIPRSGGVHEEWLEACKGGKPANSNFDYSGPLTETILLGTIAIRMKDKNVKLYWDGPNLHFTNLPEANEYIHRQYRQGWSL